MKSPMRIALALSLTTLFVLGTANAGIITTTGNGGWKSTTPDAPWPGGILPGLTDTVVIADADTVTFDTTATIAGLTVGQGVSGTFQTSKTIVGNLTINGDLTINTGATFTPRTADTTGGFRFAAPHTLTITGNIKNSGLVFDCRNGSATSVPPTLAVINITFAGSTNDTVTMIPAFTTTNGEFNSITINKTGSGRVVLGSNIYVAGGSSSAPVLTSIVTFVRGIVETGPYTFVALTSTGANVTGASDSSYVLGAMGRGMSNSQGSGKDFPVGDAFGYRPFNLRSTTAGTSTGHHAIVRSISGNANTGSSLLNGGIDRVSAVRYYKINYGFVLGGAATMSFDRFRPTYGTDDGVAAGNTNLRTAYSTDDRATWTKLGQTTYPDTTRLTSLPREARPDSLFPNIVLSNGGTPMWIALADTLGSNPLVRSTVITATAGSNGTISPSGITMVVLGADQTFLITPTSGYLVDTVLVDGAKVDSTTSYTFKNVTTSHTINVVFKASAPTTTTVSIALASGWNLISSPVTNPVPGDSVKQLFPTSLNPYAFEYSGGYVQRYQLANGKGYWGKFPAATSNDVTGTPRTRDSISVLTGWNIVGTITNTVDTNTIVSVPGGLRASAWFGYLGGYAAVTQLVPGKGYWVKSNGTGKFVLANPLGKVQASVSGPALADVLNSLTITDSRGGSQTLYFGGDAEGQLPLSMYAMPPLPPVGGFDARFTSAEGGSMVQRHAAKVSGPVEFPVEIQSDAYPLTVSWKVSKGAASYELADGRGGQAFRSREMTGEGSVKITNSELNKITVRLMGGGQRPSEYVLSQNFPNPFNPTTNIKFALPVESRVTMEIYDLLGQRVRTLISGAQTAGYHVAEWDGTNDAGGNLPSGVYFLRLTAAGNDGRNFNEVRKLMMLK